MSIPPSTPVQFEIQQSVSAVLVLHTVVEEKRHGTRSTSRTGSVVATSVAASVYSKTCIPRLPPQVAEASPVQA